MKKGNKARAKEEFGAALQINPGNDYAKRMLQWLK
jgi:hypothetical protein